MGQNDLWNKATVLNQELIWTSILRLKNAHSHLNTKDKRERLISKIFANEGDRTAVEGSFN